MEPLYIYSAIIGLIILGIVLTLVNTGAFASKTSKKTTFLLVGPSGSGKTSLFMKWATGKLSDTVTSTTTNTFEELKVPFDGGLDETVETVRIVDIPGHSKLRSHVQKALEDYDNAIRGIVFVIDSAAGAQAISQAASFLYWLLQKVEKKAGGIAILVAANKGDVFNALPVTKLRDTLEKEIDALRSARSKGVGDVDLNEDDEDGSWIGLEGQFHFKDLESEFAVMDGSVTASRTSKWDNWVQQHALNE
uniref:Signal recognition particle receptor subunit beta n=1 Tax=Blastobotrys adeninivorans TaxID=409370 RepID=A0A060TAI6_BLAAD